jgi:hypothetical protein
VYLYLFDKVDPVDVPASTQTTILVTIPTSASSGEQVISPMQGQRDYRASPQTLSMHKMLPTAFPYHSFFSSDDETTWESASAYSSDDESGPDDDWHQFRVSTLTGFTNFVFLQVVLVRGDPSPGSICGFCAPHRTALPRIVIRLCLAWGPRGQTNIATDRERRDVERDSPRS